MLEIKLHGTAEKEVGSMWVFVISTPSECISRYILLEGTWKFCQMDPRLVCCVTASLRGGVGHLTAVKEGTVWAVFILIDNIQTRL